MKYNLNVFLCVKFDDTSVLSVNDNWVNGFICAIDNE